MRVSKVTIAVMKNLVIDCDHGRNSVPDKENDHEKAELSAQVWRLPVLMVKGLHLGAAAMALRRGGHCAPVQGVVTVLRTLFADIRPSICLLRARQLPEVRYPTRRFLLCLPSGLPLRY